MSNLRCTRCGSYAINELHHGRSPGRDTDLCDVCYWRKRAEEVVGLGGTLKDRIPPADHPVTDLMAENDQYVK